MLYSFKHPKETESNYVTTLLEAPPCFFGGVQKGRAVKFANKKRNLNNKHTWTEHLCVDASVNDGTGSA